MASIDFFFQNIYNYYMTKEDKKTWKRKTPTPSRLENGQEVEVRIEGKNVLGIILEIFFDWRSKKYKVKVHTAARGIVEAEHKKVKRKHK